MSDKNREGKRTARERIAVERERQKARERRRRTLIVGSTVVCVLALAAVIGVIAANTGEDKPDTSGPVAAPTGASGQDSLVIPVGQDTARSTLTVWEDFRCPACKNFEDTYRSTIHELTEAGKLRVEYRLATLIDKSMGGSGSLRAANAAACAQDAGKFTAYHDVLFENQPAETDDDFADNSKLIDLARKVDGLVTPAFEKCLNDGTHNSWVAKSNQTFEAGGFGGTPTILLNGKNVYSDKQNPLTPDKLKQMVEEAAKA
ncbi:DsbA family protein [Streptomyces himalayensis]|uniref:Thioredoxin domain-containing protein n=1 Tax=Streptomyces himalayensis subsp. himalayensis TaxID=2756131 RepID=A0A7W0DP48_9ACTN|nr:thioredoxin domain-containing protein [Streptomyces himalayensis]MBA2948687.1 thioredoxin domain-containing protein [Streptomyces himalayensis subsp. himalayensis]